MKIWEGGKIHRIISPNSDFMKLLEIICIINPLLFDSLAISLGVNMSSHTNNKMQTVCLFKGLP